MQASDQGNLTGRYQFVGRTLVFLTCGSKVLLLKGSPQKRIWPNLYNGIGGHIEPGESILEAARRELKEETGIVSASLRLCAVATIDLSEAAGVLNFIFRGVRRQASALVSSDGTLEWVEDHRLAEIPLVEDLCTLLPVVLSFKPGDPVRFFHYDRAADGKLSIRMGSAK